MTDQTIPAGLTRNEARAVREWAERVRDAEVQDETMYHAARVLLAVLPKRPTLADMYEEEREDCKWLQANVKDGKRRAVIVNPCWEDGIARVLWPGGCIEQIGWEYVTPRLDLPLMEWPGTEKPDPAPAPALPEGWRLADHEDHGRVIATSATPNRNGNIYFLAPAAWPMGYDCHFCDPSGLTYIDTGQEADQ